MLRFHLNRREWMRVAGLAGMGLARPAFAAAGNKSPLPGFGKAKSVLLVYAPGGMSHFETWDPKPNAPAEIRGEFGSIQSAVPGVRFGEHMPKIAKVADRLTILRSMSHDDGDHGTSIYMSLTGVPHQKKSGNPPVSPNDRPTYGAILKRVRPDKKLPYTAVHVNGPMLAPIIPAAGQFAGILGRGFEPLIVGDLTEKTNALADLDPRIELPAARLDGRKKLLASLDDAATALEADRSKADRRELIGKAFDLLASERLRCAFNLDQEPEKVRQRYGDHYSGLACLLGRRLVEAGIPWITVFFNHGIRGQDAAPDDTDKYGWDTHNDIFNSMKDRLLPRFDQSFSCLIEDLEQRGLLDTTLVICLTEFGRSPLVAIEEKFEGASPGRKHWGMCYSIALAGAGIKPGTVYGASDRHGAYPSLNPVSPRDLAATMFHSLGIDPEEHFVDGADRPWPITTGTPVLGLYQ